VSGHSRDPVPPARMIPFLAVFTSGACDAVPVEFAIDLPKR